MRPPVNYTAAVLAERAEELAPVSGPRCRSCGCNVKMSPPDEVWTVLNGAAWCPDCVQLVPDADEP